MESFAYCGSELELFANATHWKAYLYRNMRRYLGSRVLEVGAGLGETTQALCQGEHDQWVCLEPDAQLTEKIEQKMKCGELPKCCQHLIGTIEDTEPASFDSVLYIDVLEHIEQDEQEVAAAASRLVPGGHLIVVSPAHQWLFTPFDEAIGHYRRYTRKGLLSLAREPLVPVRAVYLDSVGLTASLANKVLLQQKMPTPRQIYVWDSWMVPMSRIVDPLTAYCWGKSVMAVWQRAEDS